jgi:hypothetical protein
MAQINYTFQGVNTRDLELSVNNLRTSSTFRQMELDASARYDNVVIVMGPGINPLTDSGLHRIPAVSGQASTDPRTFYIFLDTKSVAAISTPAGEVALRVPN